MNPTAMQVLKDNSIEHLRLITKVAQLYYERGLTQPEIKTQLSISQARVSRLLKLAEEQGIVRTTVHVPPGVFSDLEEAVERRYGLDELVVVDTAGRDDEIIPALGSSAAAYLEMRLPGVETIGVSSWSETLLAAVNAMRPIKQGMTTHVVQVLGGFGKSGSQVHARRLMDRLAQLTGATPVFLLSPGMVSSHEVQQVLRADPVCQESFAHFDHLAMLLIGIGSMTPSRLLRDSGNVFNDDDRAALGASGAVGDICLRFFDADGKPVESGLDERTLGIDFAQIRATPKRVAVAGGERKFEAIRAVLRGGWVNTLITDLATAKRLREEP
jgi:DNA-binding transcriptional regulator LsrR (DeoR family)